MRAIAANADQLLRATGSFRPAAFAERPWWLVPLLVITFAPVYGAAMGTYAFDSPERTLQVVYSAVKLPLLLAATTALCMPAFLALSTVLGLRDDLRESLQAIFAGQAVMSITLAALAPFTLFFYAGSIGYPAAKVINGAAFAIATLAAQAVIRRYYRELLARNRAHALLLVLWGGLYVFVGIQMGWTLRPFIGQPGTPTTFFREGAFTNAYVEVLRALGGALRGDRY